MYHCCHIGIQAGGGGGGAPEFGTISFHFVGTDNDKIKIVGGNIIGKKLFICWKILSCLYQIFWKSVKY